jgi:integrase
MASLERMDFDGRDGWRLRFYVNKRRVTLGLGAFVQSEAEESLAHVEHLLEMNRRDRPPQKSTSRWLSSIPKELYDRLANFRLVEPREVVEQPRTILAFMRAYIASRKDWKKPQNYQQAVKKLETFLGRDLPLGGLRRGDAERWHRWMVHDEEMSPNTAGQNIKRCRQMMRAAIDDGLIETNPFTGVKIDLKSDRTKNRFIGADVASSILEACPNLEWRTIFALCRFGGLRCPSEVLALRWSDIAWDRGRFKVQSCKTARYGKDERIVPLFPELLSELNALFAMVEPGVSVPADAYVVQRYRDNEQNLRTELNRIADNASVERWPKPFMALRASRRTELERSGKHPNHVLNAWFGHTAKVAEEHYLQVTEADFENACGPTTDSVGPLVGPSEGNQLPPNPIEETQKPNKKRALMALSGLLMAIGIHPVGFEPTTLGSEESPKTQGKPRFLQGKWPKTAKVPELWLYMVSPEKTGVLGRFPNRNRELSRFAFSGSVGF